MSERAPHSPHSPDSGVIHDIKRDASKGMHVPVRVFADDELFLAMQRDRSLQQLINVATLPGVTRQALGMPDMHEGYGFPVGGVAATVAPDGAISPGGIGFDINCGVRLLASDVGADAVRERIAVFVHELSRSIPTGYGRGGPLSLSPIELDAVLEQGCRYVVEHLRLGTAADLAHLEAHGSLAQADPRHVSARAKQRGREQLGTLGGGNHFLEVQRVDAIHDEATARAFGLAPGALTVLLHTGSRGLGHQVCTDYVAEMDAASHRFDYRLPDRQLACAPLSSDLGQRYFAAMCAAANFAWGNRQVLTAKTRDVFRRVFPGDHELRVVYDVAHNIAKLERFDAHTLCVHRKGATRAFGPSGDDLPPVYRGVGQPVFIPGSMGTASYVLVGTDLARDLSLNSACHGAGRALSRGAAKRATEGHVLRRELEARGIVVHCPSNAELAEEAPLAYKDVERVVDVVERAGIAKRVARLVPLGVLKG